MTHIFAYGSNMSTERIRARVSSATRVAVGYVTHRRLTFHKCGRDGSAKADAYYTGYWNDRVWGVVFSIAHADKCLLDEFETGYDAIQINVTAAQGTISAAIYVARPEAIDGVLKPFSWYHRFVVRGAREHRLPIDYVEYVQSIASIADPDTDRLHRNTQLLDA